MTEATVSERIVEALTGAWLRLSQLEPVELGANIVMSLAVVAAALVAGRLAKRGLKRATRALPGPADAEKHVRGRRMARFTWAILGIGLTVIGCLAVAGIWGFAVTGWLSHGVGQSLLRVAGVLVMGVMGVELSGLAIHRLLGGLARDAADPRRAGQINTLAPVLRVVCQGAIVVMAAAMLLSEAGVKVGPLLAGAGIVGLAVGFGAQTLVKDFLTGVFLIIEDIVAVGDIVRIGDFAGLVEEMTVRTIRLRDFDGTLHVFPYSEAQVIHNLTKSYSFSVFNLRISYDSDIDRALEVMRRTGAEVMADPAFVDLVLEPIEVVGVESLADSAILLKARMKTLPRQQWTVGREYNRRIKLAFDAEGVKIPYPHVRVVLPAAQSIQVN